MFCKEHKRKQDQVLFDDLLATPGDLVAGVVLPANAKLYASCAVDVTTPVAVTTIGGVDFCIADTLAGVAQPLQYTEKNVTVTKAASAPGAVTLYIEGPFGVPLKIAQG